jgi:hypothetical protein
VREIQQIVAEIDRFDHKCQEAEYTDTAKAWGLLNTMRDLASQAIVSFETAPGAEVVVLWAPDESPGVWIARRGEQATVILLDTGDDGNSTIGAQALLAALFGALGIAVRVREVEVAPDELAGEVWNWEEVALAWLAQEWPGHFSVSVVSTQCRQSNRA